MSEQRAERGAIDPQPGTPELHRPFEAIVVNRASAERHFGGGPLKVVAFNAFGGRDIDAIVARLSRPPLAGASIVVMSELDWRLPRTGVREVAAEIAGRLEMSFAFQPGMGFAGEGGTFNAFVGTAILSTTPLREVRSIPIPVVHPVTGGRFRGTPRRSRRVFAPTGVAATISIGGRRIAIGTVHLESHADPAGRERQMAAFIEGIEAGVPAIIAGDFNTTTTSLSYSTAVAEVLRLIVRAPRRFRDPERHEPLFQRLREAGFSTAEANAPLKPTFTFSRMVPPPMRPKLDWITARGLRPIAGSAAVVAARRSMLAARFSDHDFIVCDFSL
jgi:endonuclease/exonuclease/phosphatase family metal-dependent hydrolase